jgi:hypothetical protein
MNVILLYSDHPQVSATNAAIFRVVSSRIQIHLKCVGFTPKLKILWFLLTGIFNQKYDF